MFLSGEPFARTVKPSDEQVLIEAGSWGNMNFRLHFVHHKLFTEECAGVHVTAGTKNACPQIQLRAAKKKNSRRSAVLLGEGIFTMGYSKNYI
jgi:hypothetical protein